MQKSLLALLCFFIFPAAIAGSADYHSPYTLNYTFPESTRASGWNSPPWNTPQQWGILPFSRWYDRSAYRLKSFENLAYGAHPIQFPPPPGNMNAALRRERVITAAAHHIGMHYQHHHIPTFDPYPAHPEWPWIRVKSGLRGPGLDCSNFVAWVYNYALGIRLSGSVILASQQTTVSGPRKASLSIRSFQKKPTDSFNAFTSQLLPGDVLYLRGKNGCITHSVFWVGSLASDANGKDQYFVIDSTSSDVRDSSGISIPDGVHIRPFRENSWYFRNAAIVHRIIIDNDS